MKKQEAKLLKKVFFFLIGLYFAIPGGINIIDIYILPLIWNNTLPNHPFYSYIGILIVIARILIVLIPIKQFIDILSILGNKK